MSVGYYGRSSQIPAVLATVFVLRLPARGAIASLPSHSLSVRTRPHWKAAVESRQRQRRLVRGASPAVLTRPHSPGSAGGRGGSPPPFEAIRTSGSTCTGRWADQRCQAFWNRWETSKFPLFSFTHRMASAAVNVELLGSRRDGSVELVPACSLRLNQAPYGTRVFG